MVTTPRCHGVLVTFRRPAELSSHLRIVAAQTRPLASLLVVDNDDDPAVRARRPADTRYLGLAGNPGPAGAIAAGLEEVLSFAADDDWLVLLDDDDPPRTDDTFEALQKVLAELGASRAASGRAGAIPVGGAGGVGGVGLWGATLRRTGRLRAATGTVPELVAYLPGGACPHYSVAALRVSGGPDPSLFFGFDDLDLGLRLRRAGWSVWSSGRARDHGWAEMVDGRHAAMAVERASWRRYYSLRNLVVVLRRDRRRLAALTMSLLAGVAKPILNLVVRPGAAWSSLRLNARALRDGWRGRTGKTLDPEHLPEQLR